MDLRAYDIPRRLHCATSFSPLAVPSGSLQIFPKSAILHWSQRWLRPSRTLSLRTIHSFTIYRRSRNPRPSKIAGIAFSIRAVRVADSFAPAK
jgi:hypothetical protein